MNSPLNQSAIQESLFSASSPEQSLQSSFSKIDTNEIARRYASPGNTVNYVITYIEGHERAKSDSRLELLEQEISKNILTAVIEHPLAESVGRYTYTNSWRIENGILRLCSDFGYLDEIIHKALDDQTGQIPEFEKARNERDLWFLGILTQERSYHRSSPLIKFSPSPPLVEDPEVRKRGYRGYDQISYFNLDPDGREEVTIFWFPQSSVREYLSLCTDILACHGTETTSQRVQTTLQRLAAHEQLDITLMDLSDVFSPAQIDVISKFLDSKREIFKGNESHIQRFCHSVIYTRIQTTILPLVVQTASLILDDNEERARANLEEIYQHLSDLQFELHLYIRDIIGINTFSGVNPETSYQTYISQGALQRQDQQSSIGYTASGCGFGDSTESGRTMFSLWGLGSLFGFNAYDPRFVFICPNCHTFHHINTLRHIYVKKCRHCGFDARC